MNLDFNFPLVSFLLLTMVTSQNPVFFTLKRLKLHHIVFRNCRAILGLTNKEKLSGSSKLYKIKVDVLWENTDPEDGELQVKYKSFSNAPNQKISIFLNIRKPHFVFASMGSFMYIDITYFAQWVF